MSFPIFNILKKVTTGFAFLCQYLLDSHTGPPSGWTTIRGITWNGENILMYPSAGQFTADWTWSLDAMSNLMPIECRQSRPFTLKIYVKAKAVDNNYQFYFGGSNQTVLETSDDIGGGGGDQNIIFTPAEGIVTKWIRVLVSAGAGDLFRGRQALNTGKAEVDYIGFVYDTDTLTEPPFYVSSECSAGENTISVTFTESVSGNETGWTVKVNSIARTITNTTNGITKIFTFSGAAIQDTDAVTIEYNASTGSNLSVSSGIALGTINIKAATIDIPLSPPAAATAIYTFDGNSNDSSGNGHHLSAIGTPSLTTGRGGSPNTAYLFDGSTDGFETSAKVVDTLPLSFSAWVKLGTANQIGTIVLAHDKNNADNLYQLRQVNGGDEVEVLHYKATSNNPRALGISSLFDGNWHHVVGVFGSNSSRKIYVDGVLEDHNTDANTVGVAVNIDYLSVGGPLQWSTGDIQWFNGSIDDVQIFDFELSPNEVLWLYQN